MMSIRKNAREELRIERQEYRGHDLVNIRVWYDDGSGEYLPGKQGVAFKVDVLPDVMDALAQVSAIKEAA